MPKTPEWAEPICAVPAETIARIGREYATTKPAMLFQGWGPQRRAIGEQFVRFGIALAAMTGNIGISGGGAVGVSSPFAGEFAPAPGMSIPPNPVPYSFPVHSWTDAVLRGNQMTRFDGVRGLAEGEETLPNSIKFFYNPAGNTLVNQHSNINRTIEILKDESLAEFIVSHEHFMTPSARYSDIVLPVCTFMETWGSAPTGPTAPRILSPSDRAAVRPPSTMPVRDAGERLGIYDEFQEGGKTEKDWYNGFIDGMLSEIGDITAIAMPHRARSMTIPYTADIRCPRDFIADPVANPLKTTTGKIEIFSTCSPA